MATFRKSRGQARRGKKDAKREVRREARHAKREVEQAAGNRWLKLAMRFGYVVRGVLYGVMGALALELATGRSTHATDQRGAVALLVANPLAKAVLASLGVGLLAYAAWGFVRAIFDPLRRGGDVAGLTARLGFAWSGFAYASLLFVVLQILFGGDPHSLDRDSVQETVSRALMTPAGVAATVVAGVIGIVAGIGQFVDAWRAGFRNDLKRREMSEEEVATALWLGRYGLVARGVIFSMTGWFILQAGLHRDAALAHGFGAAFAALMQAPLGHVTVAAVGLGFLALALHSLAYARWVRMMPG